MSVTDALKFTMLARVSKRFGYIWTTNQLGLRADSRRDISQRQIDLATDALDDFIKDTLAESLASVPPPS